MNSSPMIALSYTIMLVSEVLTNSFLNEELSRWLLQLAALEYL